MFSFEILCHGVDLTTIVSVLARVHVGLKTWVQIIIAKWLLTGHKRSLWARSTEYDYASLKPTRETHPG
jgi:hypothetical protein